MRFWDWGEEAGQEPSPVSNLNEQVAVGLLVSALISSLFQVAIVLVLPFVLYVAREHTTHGFWASVGLRRPRAIAVYWALGGVVASFALLYGLVVRFGGQDVLNMPGTVTKQLQGSAIGVQSMLTVLVLAFVQTALAEEIFFRGFLGKRLAARWGFVPGNTVQAAAFGLLHSVLLVGQQGWDGLGLAIGLGLGAAAIGYVVGFINERIGNGSIVPGWIGHGVTNAVTFFLAAFTNWV